MCLTAAVELNAEIPEPLWGVSPLHTLPYYFATATFQRQVGKKKMQEGSVPAHSPINTWQFNRLQTPLICKSIHLHSYKFPGTFRVTGQHSHKHCIKTKTVASSALANKRDQ